MNVATKSPPRPDRRLLSLAATLLLVGLGGWGLNYWNAAASKQSLHEHADQQLRDEIDRRFKQGVVMLHTREYEHAMTAFHRVLQLAPTMPEAHVNAGFALIGLKRFKEALAFFDAAIDLRRGQVNAYYGMAVALEGLGDLPGATGAMESYLHLSKADDPYRRKAEAALWEWRARTGAAAPDRPLPRR